MSESIVASAEDVQKPASLNMKALRKLKPEVFKSILKKQKKKKSKEKKKKLNGQLSLKLSIPVKAEVDDVEITYIKSDLSELQQGIYNGFFDEVIERFNNNVKDPEIKEEEKDEDRKIKIKEIDDSFNEDEEDEQNSADPSKLSRKKLKQMNQPSITQLKQICKRPEVVEAWDVTATEPFFLVSLKSSRNTVPVPDHWNQKRKYMQGKRGIEKAPFKLPHYIEQTKISEIRQALQEKEANKSLKQRQREKARPKSHRMDIDYQVLHDAFFKYSTKPQLTGFGDIYYEGKEYELKMRQFTPGKYSERLKQALSMTENAPPSWLINMQRFGPPPSYPNLKIPGLNCPIPKGCVYGYQAGGWGKPPVDEFDNPLYGDFSFDTVDPEPRFDEPCWSELADDSEEEYEEEGALADTTEESAQIDGTQTPISTLHGTDTPLLGGITSVGGLTSVTSGLETPASLDLRRRGYTSTGAKPYTILPQKKMPLQPGALFSTNIAYKMPPTGIMHGGATTIMDGTMTPSGMSTPMIGGLVTPYANVGSGAYFNSQGGTTTPLQPPGGMITPNLLVPDGGLKTPTTGTLGRSVPDQDGQFTVDSVNSELKKFGEKASKTIKAAGLIDPSEANLKKLDSQDYDKKKKKKKEFKF